MEWIAYYEIEPWDGAGAAISPAPAPRPSGDWEQRLKAQKGLLKAAGLIREVK